MARNGTQSWNKEDRLLSCSLQTSEGRCSPLIMYYYLQIYPTYSNRRLIGEVILIPELNGHRSMQTSRKRIVYSLKRTEPSVSHRSKQDSVTVKSTTMLPIKKKGQVVKMGRDKIEGMEPATK